MSEDLPPEIQVWLHTWREVVLDPLRGLHGNPWSIQRMADELALRVEERGPEGADGRMRNASGISKTTLQKEMSGERMPSRDVVEHLLDIARENLLDPPSSESQQALWDSYYPALERKVPLLVSLYRAIDARDDAVRALAAAKQRENQLREELDGLLRQEHVMRTGLGRVQAYIEHAEEIVGRRPPYFPRNWPEYAERFESLTHKSRELSDQLDGLSRELDELRGQSNRAKRAAKRALRMVRRTQRMRERELMAEVEALREERDKLLMLLERAQVQAESTHREARYFSNDPAHGLVLGRRSEAFEVLRRRAEVAPYLQQDLREQLRRASERIEGAQAEADRQDTALAHLVEEQSIRIARLREGSVLSEADKVLAAVLEQLSWELGA